jgi:hypothetical protein
LLDWDRELCITADDNEANARRLVACWNACDGLPQDDLDELAEMPNAVMNLARFSDDLVKERDELVSILRRTVKYANRKPFNLTKEIDAVLTKYPEAS